MELHSMGHQSCPRCETQLDAVALTCPACAYDAMLVEPEPELPYVDRFRGTEFEGVPVPARSPILTLGRGRVLVAGALLAIVAL